MLLAVCSVETCGKIATHFVTLMSIASKQLENSAADNIGRDLHIMHN